MLKWLALTVCRLTTSQAFNVTVSSQEPTFSGDCPFCRPSFPSGQAQPEASHRLQFYIPNELHRRLCSIFQFRVAQWSNFCWSSNSKMAAYNSYLLPRMTWWNSDSGITRSCLQTLATDMQSNLRLRHCRASLRDWRGWRNGQSKIRQRVSRQSTVQLKAWVQICHILNNSLFSCLVKSPEKAPCGKSPSATRRISQANELS